MRVMILSDSDVWDRYGRLTVAKRVIANYSTECKSFQHKCSHSLKVIVADSDVCETEGTI